MKKSLFLTLALVVGLAFFANGAWAYNINDTANDSIGYPIYETYGINVTNFTPGINNGGIGFQIYTNFPQAGNTVNGSPAWLTLPADVFITESYSGAANGNVRQDYLWAVPLVTHGTFVAGTTYAVGSSLISDNLDPSGGSGYNYNHNVPVQISTQGTNYGLGDLGAGSVAWSAAGGLPDYMISVVLGWYEDDPFATLTFNWGTASCANDVITGMVGSNVPLPPSVLLIGTGLLGLGLLRFRRKETA